MRKKQQISSRQRSKSPIIKSYINKKSATSVNMQNQTQTIDSKSRLTSFKSLQIESSATIPEYKSPLKTHDSAIDVITRNKRLIQMNEKSNLDKNQKLFNKVIFYQNNTQSQTNKLEDFRVEAFFNDGTSISWKKQTLIFLSAKAIKTRVNILDSYRSEDLSFKLIKVIQELRKYNDFYLNIEGKMKSKIQLTLSNSKLYKDQLESKRFMEEDQKLSVYKKYKIEEFNWQKCRINVVQNEGYEIQSNDQNAKVILLKDLFRIRVSYLQLTNGRKVKGKQNFDSDEENDNILDRYTFHPPTGIKSNNKKKTQNDILYQYHRVYKQFSVFNLPYRWYYPIDQIWTYLLANKIIKHDFIYIDFVQQDIELKKNTKMPQCIIIGQNPTLDEGNHLDNQIVNLPLYGKPTHQQKCRWISFQCPQSQHSNKASQERIIWLISQSEQNLFYDGHGFWKSSSDGNSVLYKIKNCFETVIKYLFGAIPLTVRIQNQPERCLQSSLTIFKNYIDHNRKLEENQTKKQNQRLQDCTFMNSSNNRNPDDVIFNENLPDIGQFKVYGNGIVVGKFVDRVMLTLKGQIVTLIDDIGQNLTINLNKKEQYADKTFEKNIRNPYVRYREHLRYISDFYERIFHYEEWIRKQQLLQGLNNLKIANQAFLNVCQNIKKS